MTDAQRREAINRSLSRGHIPTGLIIEQKRRDEDIWTALEPLFQKWRDDNQKNYFYD